MSRRPDNKDNRDTSIPLRLRVGSFCGLFRWRRKQRPQISHPIIYTHEKPSPKPVPGSTTDEYLPSHSSRTAYRHGGHIDITRPGQGAGVSLPPIVSQPPLVVSADAFDYYGTYGHGSQNTLGHGAETTGESSGWATGGIGVEAGVGAEGGGWGGEGGAGGGEGGCG